MKEEENKNIHVREHLANERTLLAWIRTSIGIMAFGFVVVKFSLFIKQISLLIGKNITLPQQHGYSSIIGIVLVITGGVILLLSYLKYKKTKQDITNGLFNSESKLILPLVIVILIISILLTIYLIENASKY